MRTSRVIAAALIVIAGLLQSELVLAIPAHTPPPGLNELRLGLITTHYFLESRQNRAEMQGNFGATADWRGESVGQNFSSGVEASGLLGVTKSDYRYINVAEAYLSWHNDAAATYLGRKRFEWSLLDSEWSIGMFQPRMRFDYLQERDNGLAGFFFVTNPKAPAQFMAFASPLFIPERGAPFDMSEGTCRTTSPWFICPQNSVVIYDVATPVHFKVDMPPIKKIIFKPSAAAALKIGESDQQFFRFSAAYKPINYVYLGYEGKLNLSTETVPIILHPRFPYHLVLSTDGRIPTGDRAALQFGVMRELVYRDYPPATWNTQEPYNTWLYGAGWKASIFSPESKTAVSFNYFHREGGDGDDRGPLATPGKPLFEGRYNFKNAFSYGLQTAVMGDWADRFLLSLRFILDTTHTGNIFTGDIDYKFSQRFNGNIGVDILGSNNNTKADFISRYQQNDRVRGGISYVF